MAWHKTPRINDKTFLFLTISQGIYDNMRYCQKEKGLVIYAWCMPSHLHMIISTSQDPNLAQVLRTCDGMRESLCSNETLLAIIGSFTNAQGGKHPLIQAAVFSPLACFLDVRGLYLSSMSSKYNPHPDGCYFVTFQSGLDSSLQGTFTRT
ncbi:MAG: hypothetical protein QM734_17465 [Cyclobacteriaceae bacterium]